MEIAWENKERHYHIPHGEIRDKLTCGREAAQLTAGEFNRMVSMVAYKAKLRGREKAPYS